VALDLQLLGPIEATLDSRPVPLGPTKQRAVLAMLALQVNRTVSVDRLVDGLWGAAPPDSAPKMVQLYVSQLRKALAGDSAEILTRGRGYELRLASEAVDAERFESLVDAAARGGANGAAREALALWRGDALSDVVGEPFAAAEIRRLEELWLRATELAIDEDLACGRHAEVIGELEALVAAYPLQERLHIQRMLALYRSGRQAEALAAYRQARSTLVEEIGVEPGAELRRLHDAVLSQDPALDAPVETPAPAAQPAASGRAPPRRRPFVLAAALVIASGLAVFAASRWIGPEPLARIDENAVGLIDSGGGGITAQYPVGRAPRAIAMGAGSAWVANARDATVSRVEPDRPTVTIPLRGEPGGLAYGAGSLWVTLPSARAVARLDPATNRELRSYVVANAPRAVAVGSGALWVGSEVDRTVTRIDLSDASSERINLGSGATAIGVGADSVWVASEEGGNVFRIEPRSGDVVATIDVGHRPVAVAVGAGAAWVVNRQDATVSRIDVATDSVTDIVPVGQDPSAIAFGEGAVWVADSGSGTVSRIDPNTRRRTEIAVRSSPSALAVSDGSVWAAALASPASHRGGTLTVETNRVSYPRVEPGSYADTAVHQALSLAYDSLVTYRRAGGTAFGVLVGNLAENVPDPSPDGRTYVFRLRPGIRYSDGTVVNPADFRAALEDLLSRHGWLPKFYSHIIGAPACVRHPATCDLSEGIVTDARNRTITLHLSTPDPELLDKLAYPFASVVPAAHPFGTRLPPPGTGPYRIVSFAPASGVRLVRNPHFDVWSQDARPDGFADEILLRTRDAIDAQATAVERGEADIVVLDNAFGQPLPAGRLPAIAARNPGRLHTDAALELDYMFLNARTPPFDDARVRRAINYAVDRRRIAQLAGGPDLAQPTCQILPPGFPNYAPHCRYTISPDRGGGWIAPDVDRARRLIAQSGTAGMPVTVWGYRQKQAITRYFVTLLHDLGYSSAHHLLDVDYGIYRDELAASPTRPQIGIEGFSGDVAMPSMFAPLFLCSSIHPRSGGNPNLSAFCDPDIDAEIAAASAAHRPEADARWEHAYRKLADAAPVVPLVNRRTVALVSKRVGNYQLHPLWGPLLDQLWVR
jgi:YVTN family beta-propeller protein